METSTYITSLFSGYCPINVTIRPFLIQILHWRIYFNVGGLPYCHQDITILFLNSLIVPSLLPCYYWAVKSATTAPKLTGIVRLLGDRGVWWSGFIIQNRLYFFSPHFKVLPSIHWDLCFSWIEGEEEIEFCQAVTKCSQGSSEQSVEEWRTTLNETLGNSFFSGQRVSRDRYNTGLILLLPVANAQSQQFQASSGSIKDYYSTYVTYISVQHYQQEHWLSMCNSESYFLIPTEWDSNWDRLDKS